MYHGIGTPPFEEEDSAGMAYYRISPARFREQLEIIASMGYVPVTFKMLHSGQELPDHPIIITFDDGESNNYHQAMPLLDEFGYHAVFFVITERIDSAGWLSADQLMVLTSADMEIGAHGATHRYLSSLATADLVNELTESRARLESILGEPVRSLSLPGGRGSRRVSATARQVGYKSVAGSEPGNNNGGLLARDIQRWAISDSITPAKFRAMISGQSRFTCAARRKYWVGVRLKTLLGERIYTKIWHLAAATKLWRKQVRSFLASDNQGQP